MIDVEKVLEKLQELNFIRLNRIMGDYYSIYCPIHKGGEERKPSCGVLLKDQYRNGQKYPAGWTHCFTCGYAKSLPDLVTDLLKSRNISTSGLDWLKQNIPGFDETSVGIEPLVPDSLMSSLENKYAINYILNYTNPSQSSYVSEEELASYRYSVKYMYDRGLTDALIERYDVGFDPKHVPPGRKSTLPCITFPVRDINGNTLFICRRSIEGKYFNLPKDINKPVYGIYELPRGCKSVVITESCLNAITSVKYGRPAVALLGTGNPYQINQLKRLGASEFILALDPDDAGRKGTARLKKALRDVAIVWEFEGIPEGKDINDLTEWEFNNLTLV